MMLAAFALAAVVWFAITYVDAHRLDHAQHVLQHTALLSPKLNAALDDARAAGTLNPDRTTRLGIEASADVRLGRLAPARAVIEQLVRLEPENVQAWDVLSRLTAQQDPRRSAQAVAKVRELDPHYRPASP